jgi:hypothetical protein
VWQNVTPDLHRKDEASGTPTGAAGPKNALDVRLQVEPRCHVVLVVKLQDRLVVHPGLTARGLRSAQVGGEVPVDGE